jgi:uncharacterized membrane protein
MTWILTILGAFLGAVIEEEEGLLLGALLGFLLGRNLAIGKRLKALELEFQRLTSPQREQAPGDSRPEQAEPAPAPLRRSRFGPRVPQPRPAQAHPQSRPLTLDEDLARELAEPPEATGAGKATGTGEAKAARAGNATSDGWQDSAAVNAPDWLGEALRRGRDYFTGGNPFVRIGVLILFFGVAFLLKYAADNSMLPVELRLGGVALGGIGLLLFGWRQRLERPNFGLVLQGGGIGVLYLTIFSAFSLYKFLPAEVALLLLVAMTAASVVLAVRQDTLALAVLGVTGGFLAPVLVSTGSGNHVALFSYYALLNLGIFGVAWFRAWRLLNWLGFVFTYGIATAWGVLDYRPEKFHSTEPFLILFFLLYLGLSVLFALRAPLRLKGYIDGTLVFGNAIIAFTLQVALVHRMEYGIALSALGMGAIYLILGSLLWKRLGSQLKAMLEAFVALGIVFTSLAIPFAIDNQWSATAWALEGAGILWIGVRQSRLLARLFGILLQLGAGILYLLEPSRAGDVLLANSAFFSTAMVAVAGLFSAWQIDLAYREQRRWESKAGLLLLIWGWLWWMLGPLWQFDHFLWEPTSIQAMVAWSAATCLAFIGLYRRWGWRGAFWAAQLLLPLLVVWAILLLINGDHPGQSIGAIAWPLALGLLYWQLHRLEHWCGTHDQPPPHNLNARQQAEGNPGVAPSHPGGRALLSLQHLLGTLFLVILITWELGERLADAVPHEIWRHWLLIYLGLMPLFALAALIHARFWPLTTHAPLYRLRVAGTLVAVMVIWSLAANWFHDGAAPPLTYLPLLNPLDLTQIAVLLLLTRWWLLIAGQQQRLQSQEALAVLGGLLFVFVTAMLLRSLSHWADIPYRLRPLFQSFLVQASLSVYWTLAGMGLMLLATRHARRSLWFIGSALLGVVVVKLFLVDLSAGGTLERIVSFVVVGLLLVAIGYFAPLPPRRQGEEQ